MPIESPQLDDLRYQVLFEQLRRQIPIYAPEWTDHNASDPGITMLQLFAHLGEQIGFRLNRLPDKAFLEMLKLIGMRLAPAEAARTLLSFVLTKPELASAFTIPAGATVKASTRGTPPTFEVDRAIDAVPAQLAALATTRSRDLRDVTLGTGAPADGDTATSYIEGRFSLVWNGKAPKLKDWPTQPVPVFQRPSEADHEYLWLGLAFNPAVTAGFLGQRATLTIQLDDDEQPDPRELASCSEASSLDQAGLGRAEYVFYRPPRPGQATGSWVPLAVLSDTTGGWSRSGVVRFDVPATLGPVPDAEWIDPRAEQLKTTEQICAEAAGTPLPLPTPIAHPLEGAIKNPVTGLGGLVPISGWIGVRIPDRSWFFSLRAVTFNAGSATAATTVKNRLIGTGTGLSDQTAALDHQSVLPGTLELAVEDTVDTLLHRWSEVADLDTAGPTERVYVLDPEAGRVFFGDGIRGQAPGFGARIVALSYRHGGGVASEVAVGQVNQPASMPSPIGDVVNVVAARGGKDAETLDQARRRAPSVLRTRGRAVTSEDFEVIARETTGVRIARAVAVPLHRPLVAAGLDTPGLDLDTRAAGAVSVIVVPDEPGPFPTPTESVLRTVCRHLDRHRLITTELFVVPPQYVRIFDLEVVLVPRPGWSQAAVRESVTRALEAWFHVLHGAGGAGTPFGGVIHHSELVAQVMRADGVDRVERLVASYDGTSPATADEAPRLHWRRERATPRRLTGCIETADDDDQLRLSPDENVFVDPSTLTVIVHDGV